MTGRRDAPRLADRTRLPAVLAGLATGALLALAPPASAQQSRVDSVAQACKAADTAARWKEVARAWKESVPEHGTDDSLEARLVELGKRDQALRTVPDLLDSVQSADFRSRFRAADSADAVALAEIVAERGWPTPTLVGRGGAEAAWLIVQHSASLQKPMLERMLALPKGTVSPSDLATLRDRVLASEGKPQIYGTQVKTGQDGQPATFYPIEDLAQLDERRAEVGLPPLDTYLCLMRGMYGEQIADPRE